VGRQASTTMIGWIQYITIYNMGSQPTATILNQPILLTSRYLKYAPRRDRKMNQSNTKPVFLGGAQSLWRFLLVVSTFPTRFCSRPPVLTSMSQDLAISRGGVHRSKPLSRWWGRTWAGQGSHPFNCDWELEFCGFGKGSDVVFWGGG
jgi:hypothetical protein